MAVLMLTFSLALLILVGGHMDGSEQACNALLNASLNASFNASIHVSERPADASSSWGDTKYLSGISEQTNVVIKMVLFAMAGDTNVIADWLANSPSRTPPMCSGTRDGGVLDLARLVTLLLFVVCIIIVMLNMLIAIVSEVYDHSIEKSEDIFYMSRIEHIVQHGWVPHLPRLFRNSPCIIKAPVGFVLQSLRSFQFKISVSTEDLLNRQVAELDESATTYEDNDMNPGRTHNIAKRVKIIVQDSLDDKLWQLAAIYKHLELGQTESTPGAMGNEFDL